MIMGELRGRVVEVRGPETVMHIPSNAKSGLLNYVKSFELLEIILTRVSQNPLNVNLCLGVERLR